MPAEVGQRRALATAKLLKRYPINPESVTRLTTAFQNLHKLRAGMVRPERDSIGAHVQQVANKSEKWLTHTAMEKLLDQYRIAMARDWQKSADLRHSAKRSTPHNALHNRMEFTEQGYPANTNSASPPSRRPMAPSASQICEAHPTTCRRRAVREPLRHMGGVEASSGDERRVSRWPPR